MSSFGYVEVCPVCKDENAQFCEESRPFHFVTITCSNCGFFSTPHSGQMSLDEVNELREDIDDLNELSLEPLIELPKIDPVFFIEA